MTTPDEVHLSYSGFKSFKTCEAAALAEYRGEWKRRTTPALLIGSYVDAYFSDELDKFTEEHPEIYKKDGTLKADFQQAQALCERLDRDELARMLLRNGQHQVTKTGRIGGVMFKGRFDGLLEEEQVEAICKRFPKVRELVPFGGAMIVDLKTVKDFKPVWSEEYHERVSFVKSMGYDKQGAIYQKLDGRQAPFVIVAITKEPEPDIRAVHVPDGDLADALAEVEAAAPRYAAIKRGEIKPNRCEQCEYCRNTRKLNGIVHYKMI